MLLLPSRSESLGVAYLEAWHFKKPVIALDLPVLKNVITHGVNGLLCKPDPKLLSQSVLKLVNRKNLRHRLGNNGRDTVEKHYSWSRCVQDHQLLYKAVLNGNMQKKQINI